MQGQPLICRLLQLLLSSSCIKLAQAPLCITQVRAKSPACQTFGRGNSRKKAFLVLAVYLAQLLCAVRKPNRAVLAGELFSDHLVSVQRVLEGWHVGKELELAGLYHSIYGAQLLLLDFS